MHIEQEATFLALYLTQKAPTPQVVALYQQARQTIPVDFTPKQQKLWNFCTKNNWALKFVDAALALGDNYHPVRKRIFIMLAILETQPAYNDCFLPQKRSKLYLFKLALSLTNAVAKM